MFPNQQEQESWVPSSEYCGNYSGSKLSTCPPVNEGPSWYNWAQSTRSYSDNLWKHMGTEKQGETSNADYQINSSCFMSNEDKKIKEEVLDFIPRSKKSSAKLGINSNVYKMYSSLYQNTQRKQFLAQNCVNRYNMKPGVITTSIFGNIPMSKYSTEDIPSNYLENSQCTSKEYSQKTLPNEPLQTYSDMQESPELPETFNRSEQTLFVEPDSSTDLEPQTSNEQLSESYQDMKKLKKKNSQENENFQTDIMDANSTFEDSTDTEDFFGNGDDDYDDDDDDFEDEDDFGMGTNESILLPSSNEDECRSEEMSVKVKMEQDPMVSNYKPKLLNPKKSEIPKALKWENSNKKMVNKDFGSGLPLEVQLQEYNQPSRYIPRNFFNNSIMPDQTRPKKRGRKPKHYSDILYELGQRGTSVTMTSTMKKNSPSNNQQTLPSCAKLGSGQQLKCPHCNKILTTSVGLMYHIRLHTGEKPYSCDLCGKSFATSSHYHYHIRTHSGGKPYRCDLCGKMYTASGSLRLHLKTHLSQLSDRALMTNIFPVDPLMVRENDLPKIKQEILDPENFEVQQ